MSTTPYLDDFGVDPEIRRILDDALEKTRASLGLADDFANGIIAKQIIELAKAGEHNPGSRVWRGRAAMPPDLPTSSTASAANGWNCSKRSRHA